MSIITGRGRISHAGGCASGGADRRALLVSPEKPTGDSADDGSSPDLDGLAPSHPAAFHVRRQRVHSRLDGVRLPTKGNAIECEDHAALSSG